MRITDIKTIAFVLPVAAAMLFLPLHASAGLTVESAITRVGVERGSQWDGSVGITNTSDTPVRLSLDVINLERTADGVPVPLFEQPIAVRERTLAGWLVPETRTILLQPHGSVRVPVRIAVPDFAASGLYTAALLFRSVPIESDDHIATAAAIAAAFQVRVGGESDEDVSLISFGPVKFLWTKGPVTVQAVFANRSAVTAAVEGMIQVDPLVGTKGNALAFTPAAQGPQLDPVSERTFELVAEVGPGMYRAVLNADTGTSAISESVYFVVLPWPLLAIVLLAASGAFFMSRRAVRALVDRGEKRRKS